MRGMYRGRNFSCDLWKGPGGGHWLVNAAVLENNSNVSLKKK